ncbi:C_GCAxxG_C_C family probable redox protein [Lentimicrobium saccharophilum]|uniref:C_GCAxxG_C_C family probable redox protein n=1 Tax=Lentimicrobium saccharophilum TaxID=1678841 RepID=A0A0S7BXW7_9BACT|nr:C-GCAxxG-C-C family protein [Lentimicrobium saccharophilum]GAP42100.1 C_GCAxxG_C_C family probable redox protein [Lentimicrobium saccharophilum]
MSRSTEAVTTFASGFNCAQSILYPFGRQFFRDDVSAFRLGSAFGGGIASRGEICGAVSGSLMVIGLHFGYSPADEASAKAEVRQIYGEFLQAFEHRFGDLHCNKLLQHDLSTAEGREEAKRSGAFQSVCPVLIEGAAMILEEILQRYSAADRQRTPGPG